MKEDHGAQRIWEIDFLRGLAIILMVCYHLLFDLGEFVGIEKFLGWSTDLSKTAWILAQFGEGDVRTARAVIDRYRDQDIGLADASQVVLAHRHRTRRILTLDRRHFDVIRPLDGGRFTLLP